MKNADMAFAQRLMDHLTAEGVEFRRGSAGGGNQLRQPYLKALFPEKYYLEFPETEHIHFYAFYIGNFPDLSGAEVDEICAIINLVE